MTRPRTPHAPLSCCPLYIQAHVLGLDLAPSELSCCCQLPVSFLEHVSFRLSTPVRTLSPITMWHVYIPSDEILSLLSVSVWFFLSTRFLSPSALCLLPVITTPAVRYTCFPIYGEYAKYVPYALPYAAIIINNLTIWRDFVLQYFGYLENHRRNNNIHIQNDNAPIILEFSTSRTY